MNSKNFVLIVSFVTFSFSQTASYSGISKINVTPETNTPFVTVDDNCPDESYGVETRYFEGFGETTLQRNRQIVCLDNLKYWYESHLGLYYTVGLNTRRDRPVDCPITASGCYLIVLASFEYKDEGIQIGSDVIATSISDNQPAFIKIASLDNTEPMQSFMAGTASASGYKRSFATTIISEKGVSTPTFLYLNRYVASLNQKKWAVKTAPYTLAVIGSDNIVRPALLILLGSVTYSYAMYGTFKNQDAAQIFGYNAGDKIFFSEQEITPLPGSSLTGIFESKLRYGAKCWTETEAKANPSVIYPQLAWRKCQLWGDMPITFDANGTVGKVYCNGDSVYKPNNPDNPNNTNPPTLIALPDADWYFGLFQKGYDAKMSTSTTPKAPEELLDYQTYMNRKISSDYDPTLYNTDRSMSYEKVDKNNPPAPNKIFDKDCKLLSEQKANMFDPLGASTRYELLNWKDIVDGDRWIELGSEVKKVIRDVMDIYPRIINDPKNALNIPELGVNYYAPYKDSVWIIGNPWGRYEPYANATEFVMFNVNRQDNNRIFKVLTTNKKDGTGTNSIWDQKIFFISFMWPIVCKDKYGRYVQIGGIGYDAPFLIESDDGWQHVYGGYLRGKKTIISSMAGAKSEVTYGMDHGTDFTKGVAIVGTVMNPGAWVAIGATSAAAAALAADAKNLYIKTSSTDTMTPTFDEYNKDSKDYHTDQSDVSERAGGFTDMEKQQIQELITNIAVAEGVDFLMKQLHNLGNSDIPAVKNASAALYETSKRIENQYAVKLCYKTAMSAYEMYLMWQETMDMCAKMRDTYNEMNASWANLERSTKNIIAYYSNFDWKALKPTNLSSILPTAALYQMNYSVNRMQQSMIDFTAACNDMAILADESVVSPSVYVVNDVVDVVNKKLKESTYINSTTITAAVTKSISEFNNIKKQASRNPAKQQYISLITRSMLSGLENVHLKAVTNGSLGISLALNCITREALDWNTLKSRLETTYSSDGLDSYWKIQSSSNNKRSFYPFIRHFKSPEDILNSNLGTISDVMQSKPSDWDFVSISKSIGGSK